MEIENRKIEPNAADEKNVPPDEVKTLSPLEAENKKLREELAAEREARLRLAADFDNYRRRVRREREHAAEEGKRELLERLITVADDFDLAMANLKDADDSVAEGLRAIRKRFVDMLESNGVVAFESRGEIFDPTRHEAFDVIDDPNEKSGTVHSEVRRGYFWKDKLLRPALVVVAQ